MTYTVNFAGADGTPITAAGPISAVTGAPVFETTPAIHSSGWGLFSSGTVSTCIRCNTSPGTHSGSMYLYVPSAPDTNIRIWSAGNLANTTTVCNIRLKTARTLSLANASTTDLVNGAVVIPLNTVVRIDWQYDNSNTASPILTTRLFLSPESLVHDEELTTPFAGTVNVFDRINFGVVGSAAVANRAVMLGDPIRVVDGLSWIGPFAPPPPVGGFTGWGIPL